MGVNISAHYTVGYDITDDVNRAISETDFNGGPDEFLDGRPLLREQRVGYLTASVYGADPVVILCVDEASAGADWRDQHSVTVGTADDDAAQRLNVVLAGLGLPQRDDAPAGHIALAVH